MSDTRDRDALIEKLLRQELSAADGAATEACLDSETAAAWLDDGLTAGERERLEAHVADCARCQALVGTVIRTSPADDTGGTRQLSGGWLDWLAPVGAVAAIVVAAVIVPGLMPDPDAPEQAMKMTEPAAAESPDSLRERRSEIATQTSPSRTDAGRANEATPPAVAGNRAAPVPAAPPAAPPAATPPAAAETRVGAGRGGARAVDEISVVPLERRQGLAARVAEEAMADTAVLEVRSPDPVVRWRIQGTTIERTTDGGTAWVAASVAAESPVSAGSSPAPTTCWLVGRAGLVMLTTDGTTWVRIPFPEPVDLISVTATDDRSAVVRTADGRVFRTSDAGITWAG